MIKELFDIFGLPIIVTAIIVIIILGIAYLIIPIT